MVSISPSGGNGKYHLQDLHLLSRDSAFCGVSCHIADFCYTSPLYSFCKTFYPSSSISSTVFWQWSTWVVKSSKNVWTQDFNFPLGLFFHVSPTSQTILQHKKNTFLISSPNAPKCKLTASQKKATSGWIPSNPFIVGSIAGGGPGSPPSARSLGHPWGTL